MKPGKGVEVKEEIAEVHTSTRSPSPKHKSGRKKSRSRSRSGSRKLSNGHEKPTEAVETASAVDIPPDKTKAREGWIQSEQESLDIELPIHDQIKQGILGFVEQEIKKPDKDKNPAIVFYSHDPSGLDDKFLKTLSRPSSGHKEKRSPSYRKKKRHSSKHRDREQHDFEIPGSSLSALEKVDDYLKEYNKEEIVTLSGELDIEANDVENNNGTPKELRHKPRNTRRKTRVERQDSNANRREHDVSPKVFKAGTKKAGTGSKPARPTDLSAMLESLESRSHAYSHNTNDYIDNPFSSPSPVTSPNDERLGPLSGRADRIYLQGGGTFRPASRDRMVEEQSRDGDKYLRLGDITALDVAIAVQRAWKNLAPACHGILAGLSLMHLLLISYSDGLDPGHLSFHAVVTMPYVAAYFFLCVLCLVSVLDRLNIASIDVTTGLHPYFQPIVLVIPYTACLLVCTAARIYDVLSSRLDIASIDVTTGLQPYFQPIVLVILYTACLLVCTAARMYDEMMVYQYTSLVNDTAYNVTAPSVPAFYHTWTHFSIWRAVLSILGLVYFIISNPQDLVFVNLTRMLKYKHSLQSIG